MKPIDQLTMAFRLADAADAITLRNFRSGPHSVYRKRDSSPVSAVDTEVESTLRRMVEDAHPGMGFLGEEYREVGGGAGRWIVDPLDQTRNYLRGIEIYATLLAHEIDNVVQTAVISAPSLGFRWWATRGGGAFENGNPIHASATNSLQEAMVSIHSPDKLIADGRSEGLVSLMNEAASTCGFGNFWAHMLVARGALDAAVSMGGKTWDYAAPALIVREAGGMFSDITGNPNKLSGSAVSSNAFLQEPIANMMRQRQ